MIVRDYRESDWPQVWAIVQQVVRAADTFPFDPAMTEAQARSIWLEAPPGRTVVAAEGDRVLGTAKMGANRGGPGAHISTASFMVAENERGHGVGSALCRDATGWAQLQGYAGMQFNAVVETNRGAVAVYERQGFQVLGTVPRAFEHPSLGRVGLHLMYREF
ncbi:GNAT family N-acetyltransferase [Actinoplanes sp. NPDC026619]|uniref:GNAT family N-acetyltransferase n=1 Tax=Actinoplanes sp. NPDC026619 TaxID=3155798 RepID=UPI0033CC322F